MLKLPERANFHSYRVLCSDDAEQDFFKNVVHLQVILLLVSRENDWMTVVLMYAPCLMSFFVNVETQESEGTVPLL